MVARKHIRVLVAIVVCSFNGCLQSQNSSAHKTPEKFYGQDIFTRESRTENEKVTDNMSVTGSLSLS